MRSFLTQVFKVFPLSTNIAIAHELWYVIFSLLLTSSYFSNFLCVFFFLDRLLGVCCLISTCLSQMSFCYWFLRSIYYGQRTYPLLSQSFKLTESYLMAVTSSLLANVCCALEKNVYSVLSDGVVYSYLQSLLDLQCYLSILFPCWFSFLLLINGGKWTIKVENCYCRVVYFFSQFYQFLFHVL